MRIGFISIQDATDVTSWSGIPYQILQQLRAQKIDVEVLSPLSTRLKYLLAPAKLISKARKKSVTLDHFRLILHAYARQIESFATQRSIDVIFSPSTIPVTLVQIGKPIITWTDAVFHAMYDYYGKAFANMTNGAVARGKWQEETALGNCSIAAYASTWALEGASRLTDKTKLRILPFGSSLPVDHSAEELAQLASEKRRTRKNKCELLFVGVNWERKGGAIAVETAKLLNEAGIETKLTVVGSQPDGEMPPFVEVLGFINKATDFGQKQLIELFRRADFFILPTKAEAAGIVFSEASSYGLPTLTYATGGVTEYVRNGVNGICFEPGAPAAAYATQIRRMVENPAEYEAYARRAFEEYIVRLNWRTSVSQLISLCSQSVDVGHNQPLSGKATS